MPSRERNELVIAYVPQWTAILRTAYGDYHSNHCRRCRCVDSLRDDINAKSIGGTGRNRLTKSDTAEPTFAGNCKVTCPYIETNVWVSICQPQVRNARNLRILLRFLQSKFFSEKP